MRTRRWRAGVLTAVALLAACGGDDGVQTGEPAGQGTTSTARTDGALEIGSPAEGAVVRGNVATIDVELTGITLAKADGDSSGRTGHLHVFIDKQPTPVGEVIPKEAGIVHTTDDSIVLNGLSVGKHDLVVVVGDGNHTRLPGFEARRTITVEGPSVKATAPATVPANQPFKLDVKVEGVEIAAADGDRSGRRAHYHVFVDREPTPAGQAIPPKPEDGSILHSTSPSIEVGALPPGEHVLWVVLGDGAHYPLDPPVRDRVTVTVTA